MKAVASIAVVVALVFTPAADAKMSLTGLEAHTAARVELRASLGLLVHEGVGSAHVHIGRCHVTGPRGTCPGHVWGTVDCRLRVRVLETETEFLVWSDHIRCIDSPAA